MNQRITAVVENGVLRPIAPLGLPNGTRVELTVAEAGAPPEQQMPRAVKERVEEIIALPVESSAPDPNTSRDHDHYLYGAARRS